MLVAGWVLFAVSFLLPTLVNYVRFPLLPVANRPWQLPDAAGWEAFVWALAGIAGPPGVISAVTNLLVLGGACMGGGRRRALACVRPGGGDVAERIVLALLGRQ